MENQYCEIQDPPVYTEVIRRWNNETEASGSAMGAVIEELANNDAYLKRETERLDGTKVSVSEKGIRGGVASLDAEGKLEQHIEYEKVDNIPAQSWKNLIDKPSSFPASAHTHTKAGVGLGNVDNTADAAKSVNYAASAGDADTVDGKHAAAFANASHTHPKSQITDFPAELKNPAALTLKMNGTSQGAYDGSAAKEINITASGIGAAASNHSHTYGSIADRPIGLDSGYIRTGQKGGSVIGDRATAEGVDVTASGTRSHAEGAYTTATGKNSHAEGCYTEAMGGESHAEGFNAKASGARSHAEGEYTTATGKSSHAEGCYTTATGDDSHAEGFQAKASGAHSHAAGTHTTALDYQYVIGIRNRSINTEANGEIGDRFIIGGGSAKATASKNCFRVHSSGAVYSTGAYNTSGADYAEYFEWWDSNVKSEERVGYFVTLDGEKIKIASPSDYILGIISSTPSVIGNSCDDQWHGMELCDEWGRPILEKYTKPEEYQEIEQEDGSTEQVLICPETTGRRIKINPDYNDDKLYVGRSKRPEWSPVGMLGVLRVRDDGTCQVNGYCTVADGGIATASNNGYRVLKRISENIVKVLFR